MRISFKDILEELNEISDDEIEISDFRPEVASKALENELNNKYKQAGLNGVRIEMIQPYCFERQLLWWYNEDELFDLYLGKIQDREYMFTVRIKCDSDTDDWNKAQDILKGAINDESLNEKELTALKELYYPELYVDIYVKDKYGDWYSSDLDDPYVKEPLIDRLEVWLSPDNIKDIIDGIYWALEENPEYDEDCI